MLGMGWMMLGMALFWVILIVAAIGLVRLLFQSSSSKPSAGQDSLTPVEVINLRYSRGEITREQYQQMKKDLEM